MGNSQDGFERKNSASGVKVEKYDEHSRLQWAGYFELCARIKETGVALNEIKQTLKTETMKKDIIGYKLKDEKYRPAAESITGMSSLLDEQGYPVCFDKGSHAYLSLKEAGVLKKWFEPVYKELELEVGRWYKSKDIAGDSMLFYATGEINEYGDILGYGFDGEGYFHESAEWGNTSDFKGTLATDKEVRAALIKEAKKRGFELGCKIKRNFNKLPYVIEINETTYPNEFWLFNSGSDEFLEFHGFVIYNRGEWAEIISEPTYEKSYRDILEILSELPTNDLKELNLQIAQELKNRK